MNEHNTTRRAMLATLATIPASPAAAQASDVAQPNRPAQGELGQPGGKALVACFSRTGNTRVVAGLIQRARQADVFDIVPAKPYPDEYLATVEQARQERDRGLQPALAKQLSNLARYDTVFLGFPIWGETAPPVIRTFLAAHDVAGKAVIPFITHGGYGLGDSLAVLARHAPTARLRPGFVMEGEQERRTMDRVTAWLQTRPSA